MMHRNCTCEYCCFVRDEEDDREMALEFELHLSLGRPLFDELQVGDRVKYYRLPYRESRVAFLRSTDELERAAEAKFDGVVKYKTDHKIEIQYGEYVHTVTPAECSAWGMRKIC